MQGTRTLHVPCFLIIGGVDEEAPIANTFAPELFGEYPVGDDIGVSIDNRYIPASYVMGRDASRGRTRTRGSGTGVHEPPEAVLLGPLAADVLSVFVQARLQRLFRRADIVAPGGLAFERV